VKKSITTIITMSFESTAPFVGLLFGTLLMGHFLSKTPLEELGKRSKGRDLWEWVLSFVMDGTGIWGYDSSLGAWSPPIRLAVHVSFCRILYAVSGKYSVIAYALWCYYNHHLLPNVSHPGGPRAHKIQRVPQFQDKSVMLDEADKKNWRPVVAKESHDITTRKFEGVTGATISGEPVGRQMWTTFPNQPYKGIDEKLVEQLAAGGREPGVFNAAKNPNR